MDIISFRSIYFLRSSFFPRWSSKCLVKRIAVSNISRKKGNSSWLIQQNPPSGILKLSTIFNMNLCEFLSCSSAKSKESSVSRKVIVWKGTIFPWASFFTATQIMHFDSSWNDCKWILVVAKYQTLRLNFFSVAYSFCTKIFVRSEKSKS